MLKGPSKYLGEKLLRYDSALLLILTIAIFVLVGVPIVDHKGPLALPYKQLLFVLMGTASFSIWLLKLIKNDLESQGSRFWEFLLLNFLLYTFLVLLLNQALESWKITGYRHFLLSNSERSFHAYTPVFKNEVLLYYMGLMINMVWLALQYFRKDSKRVAEVFRNLPLLISLNIVLILMGANYPRLTLQSGTTHLQNFADIEQLRIQQGIVVE